MSSVIPALDTSTSIGPWACSTWVKAASTLAASVTSQITPASPAGGSPERWVTVTRCPASANALAMARPMPRLPPVTSTERPVAGSGTVTSISSDLAPGRAGSRAAGSHGRAAPPERPYRPAADPAGDARPVAGYGIRAVSANAVAEPMITITVPAIIQGRDTSCCLIS